MSGELIGVPWDATTVGRRGARRAPEAIRQELAQRLHAFDAHSAHPVRWEDAGDARVGESHAEMLRSVEALIAERWTSRPGTLIGLLGGDHAIAYAGVSASARAFPKIAVINIDTHLDLRPISPAPSNGNWAHRVLEELHLPLAEIGYGRFSNDEGLFATAREHALALVSAEEVRTLGVPRAVERVESTLGRGRDVYLSIDIDAVGQSEAPGASAPSVDGISADRLFALLDWATGTFRVRAFDISEVNPVVDPSGRTARLAAYVALHLLSQRAP